MSEKSESGRGAGDEERGAVLEELRRVRDQPPPSEPTSGGCALAIVALVTIVLMPFIGRGFDLSGGVMAGLGAVLALIALAGGLVGLLGGGGHGGAVARDVDRALGELLAARAKGDEGRSRAAAVRLLERMGADAGTGASGVPESEVRTLAERLADARAYVERVERILRAEGEIGPVLTGGDRESPAQEG